jgi:hypothetical protein
MREDEKRTVQGKIAIVQEQRFRLMSDGGQTLLFTLAESAPLEGSDLQRFHQQGARVQVEYAGEPNVNTGVAYRVQVLELA